MKTATRIREVSSHVNEEGWVIFDLYKLSEPWLGYDYAVARTMAGLYGASTAIYPCDDSCLNYAGYRATCDGVSEAKAFAQVGYQEVY